MAIGWLPNALTLLRCGLAAICAGAVLLGARADQIFQDAFVRGHTSLGQESLTGFISRTADEAGLYLWPVVALVAFLLAAVSDYADGVLARLLKAQSSFGAWLDPVADKLLVGLSLVALSVATGSILLMIPTVLIVLRDIYITRLRGQLGGGLSLRVTATAKWKTAAEMLAIACLLLAQTVSAAGLYASGSAVPFADVFQLASGLPFWVIGLILVWISAALSLSTAARYRSAAHEALAASQARVFD